MIRYIYITLGLISLTLGILGIVTPGLPTTPFILLTAYLFSKSSPYLHKKLMDNKLTGGYIRRLNEGLSLKARLISISIMWAMIGITIFTAFKHNSTIQWIMVGLGIIGTVAQFIALRKKKPIVIPQTALISENESGKTTKQIS